MAFLLNSQSQGLSGKNEQSSQTPWRGAQSFVQVFQSDLS